MVDHSQTLDEDRVVALIREHDRLFDLRGSLYDEAEALFFGLSEAERQGLRNVATCDLPGPMGRLYREAEDLRGRAYAIFDQIVTTQATTLPGCIAQLRFLQMEYGVDEFASLETVIRGLEALEAHQVPVHDFRPDISLSFG